MKNGHSLLKMLNLFQSHLEQMFNMFYKGLKIERKSWNLYSLNEYLRMPLASRNWLSNKCMQSCLVLNTHLFIRIFPKMETSRYKQGRRNIDSCSGALIQKYWQDVGRKQWQDKNYGNQTPVKARVQKDSLESKSLDKLGFISFFRSCYS